MLRRSLVIIAMLLAGCSEYEITAQHGPDDPADGDETNPGGDIDADPGAISGRICAPNETTYVAGVEVWTETAAGIHSTVTDADGYFLLEGVLAGTHTVYAERGSYLMDFEVTVQSGETTHLEVDECFSPDDISIAVVSGSYDTIQEIVASLGFEYTLIDGGGSAHVNLLRNPAEMQKYNIIFFNCGMSSSWESYRAEIAANVRDYVHNGGSVYTSDWAYFLTEVAYPEMLDFMGNDTISGDAQQGMSGMVMGQVHDPELISVLGSEWADIDYNLPSWAAIHSAGTGSALVSGTYQYQDPWDFFGGASSHHGPLAARLFDGSGQILYTSFHNRAQTTLDMDVILEHIILSL